MRKDGNGTTVIYLVRHAETKLNRENRLQGSEIDCGLLPEGKKKAEKLRAWASGKEISFAYHSPLARARQTAEIGFGKIGRKPHQKIIEQKFGTLTGMSHDEALAELQKNGHASAKEIAATLKEHGRMYFSGYAELYGGESPKQVYERGLAFLFEMAKKHAGQTIVAVAHGAFNKILLCGLAGMPFDQRSLQKLDQPNLCVNKISVSGDKITVETVGDTSHLADAK